MRNIERKCKIMVAQSNDRGRREELLGKMLVGAGMAKLPSTAKQIISRSISDVDLDTCFFVAVQDFNFSRSHLITQKLIRMAIQGIPVFVSAKHIPNQVLQFCEVYY
ncbi:MAG: hypothetical protein IJN06_07065 [Bacteroidales bacterium]|nr:hypothetical protein [Bacteroidales bacterium]MBQ7018746.1 hypothetical protein [Bacteroidales bacterium]